ncbi:unnamed protein product [Toxocara canis]|uniref:tRNA:m(4)X modification enzyme TRM13 n=1 Tax=Toxocara canis TaxID=6265 RepID=A0A183U5Q4_TOXCA|nr:unnamed protein product [Toxocara canis]
MLTVEEVEPASKIQGEIETQQCLSGRPSEEQLSRMSTMIQMAFRKVSSRIIERVLRTPQIEDHMKLSKELSDAHRKHLVQLSSIIGNLMEANLLNNDADTCIIDLGAGKAQLSYWMAHVSPKSRFLLIDRTGCRNKYDNKALQEDPSLRFSRLRCSIEHLDLSRVDSAKFPNSTIDSVTSAGPKKVAGDSCDRPFV